MDQHCRHTLHTEHVRSNILGSVGDVVFLVGRVRQKVLQNSRGDRMHHRRITYSMGHEIKRFRLYTCYTIVYGDYIRSVSQSTLLKRHSDVAARTVRCRHIFHRTVKLVRVQRHGHVLPCGAQGSSHNLATKPRRLALRSRTASREGLHVVPVLVETVTNVILAKLKRRLHLVLRTTHTPKTPLLSAETLLLQKYLTPVMNRTRTPHDIGRTLTIHEHNLSVNHRILHTRH